MIAFSILKDIVHKLYSSFSKNVEFTLKDAWIWSRDTVRNQHDAG